MPIEFRCTNCSKLLRTGDGTAGKQARCPECGTVMTIPAAAPGGPPPSPPPSQPPSQFATAPAFQPPAQPARRITPSSLDLGEAFGRTWAVFKPNWGNCLGAIALAILIVLGVNLATLFIPFIGGLIATAFQIWIGIGLALYLLKTAQGRTVEISEIFAGGPYFLKILLANILVGLLVFGIIIVCAVPLLLVGLMIAKEAALLLGIVGLLVGIVATIYVTLALSQYYYLILDQNVDVIESLTMSRDLMAGNKLTLFGIGLLSFLISISTILTLFLGLLFTIPFFALMQPVIYLLVTGQPTADQRSVIPVM